MRPSSSPASLWTVLCAVFALAAPAAHAQTPPDAPGAIDSPSEPGRGETVEDRERPDYDPVGIRLGGFFLYPTLAATELYRDNVFYEDTNEESDFETVISPALRLNSNWNNHALNFFADADVGRFLDNSEADYEDWSIGADGRLDIQRDMNVTGGATYQRLHEDRSSPDDTAALEPTIYRRYGPEAAFNKRFNRLSVQLGGGYTWLDYDDVTTANGTTINNDDRDRREAVGFTRFGYDISPDYQTFVRLSANDRTYDDSLDDSGVSRDSQGWEAVAGLAFDFGGITFGNVFVGYLQQDYDRQGFDTVDGPSFGGDLTWNATQLTTVTAQIARTVEETTLSGASGGLATEGRLRVDHELLRNVILSADAGYSNVDYESISREDDVIDAGVGGKYLLNRNFYLQGRLSHARRDSNVNTEDYDANTVMLRLVAQH
jgi:hypothetical protein